MEEGFERERDVEDSLDNARVESGLVKYMHYLDGFALAEMGKERPLAYIEDGLKNNIIGQSHAIESVVTALYREDIRNPNRPMVSLLFLGQTGVGKSELAKQLDILLHGDNSALTVIHCSELKEDHRVSALIGAAPEYVGREQPPMLNKRKIERKQSVVLFDEIEKGGRACHDLLLQILEDGEITQMNTGAKISFRNTILILASNVGSREMTDAAKPNKIGFRDDGAGSPLMSRDEIERAAMNALEKGIFRPELLNRIDEKIVFGQLDDRELGEVLERHVRKANEAYNKKGFHLTLTPELRDELVKSCDSSIEDRRKYNARPILRKYERMVEGLVAKMLKTGGIKAGSEVYAVLSDNEQTVTPLQDKIKLYHRRYDASKDKPSTGKELVPYVQPIEKSVEKKAANKNMLMLGTAAAMGVAALILGDYLSSRRGRYA
jgi:ATP-dependent Clp protease ATP-binding subunit ClpA